MFCTVKDDKSNIPLYIAMILPSFTGIGVSFSNMISLAELVILFYYFKSEKFWVLTPIYYVYYSQLMLIGSRVTLFILYQLLVLFRLWEMDRKLRIKKNSHDIVIFILMLYSGIVFIMWNSLSRGILFIAQVLGLFYTGICIQRNKDVRETMQRVFICMCLSAAIYGVMFMNIKGVYTEQSTLIQYGGRYSGTTSDPNYMSLYYMIAFHFMAFMQVGNPWLKRLVLLALFAATALGGSLTALFTIALILILYIMFSKEKSHKNKVYNITAIAVIGFLFTAYIMTDFVEIPFLELFKCRLREKLDFAAAGDFSGATSGRTEYSMRYIQYLLDQNIFRILFGGYQLNSLGLMGEAAQQIHWAAHNSYVDILMTTGFIGLLTFLGTMLLRIINSFWNYTRNHNPQFASDGVYLVIVLFYILGLSVFPSPLYMFFLML